MLSRRPLKDVRLLKDALNSLPELMRSSGIEFPQLGRRRTVDTEDDAPMLSEASTKPPRTSFNSMTGPHRRFAFLSIPLDDIRAVKNTFGVTVNDVLMAICSSALRRYLADRDELPDDPLIAMVPISVRAAEEEGQYGNQVASMTASLHTDIGDPIERLLAIHRSMNVAKQHHRALPAKLQADVAEFFSPLIASQAERMVIRAAAKGWINLPYNVVISNVPGPQFPLYGVGAKLLANYPVSTITDGAGLNITAQSYNGNFDIGIVGCRELVPDAWAIADDIRAATTELLAAAKKQADRTKPQTKRASKKQSGKRVTKSTPQRKPAAKKRVTKKRDDAVRTVKSSVESTGGTEA
jgi:WS/DGAT/MGAT family acyltransferase